MSVCTLQSLPEEILEAIIECLDARATVALGTTSRQFKILTDAPLLWKNLCQSDFRYWNDRSQFRARLRDASFVGWKTVYRDHHQSLTSARASLRDLIKDPVGRSDRLEAIVKHGYQVRQALVEEFLGSSASHDHLAQKYWSHIALGCLHRSIALEEWIRIKHRSDIQNPTERSLAALDMFVLEQGHQEADVDDIFDRLDSYAESVRKAYPDIDDQTPRQKAIIVAEHLRLQGWVGIHDNREYHSLDHSFLGRALFASHHSSLPLISCVIYCYVARQFNLQAQPCNFPMHIHALVQPPTGFDLDNNRIPVLTASTPSPSTHLYMDPFASVEPVPVASLLERLRFIDPSTDELGSNVYLSPATPRDLLIRTAGNVLNSARSNRGGPPNYSISPHNACYAAFFARVLFPTHPATLRTQAADLTQSFLQYPHDLHVFRTYILPLTNSLPDHLAYRSLYMHLLRSDLDVPTPKLRHTTTHPPTNPSTSRIIYRVGQVFRHKRQGYLAAIYGWDTRCEMSQQWIIMNQVDRLSQGRDQPFYNAFVADDGSSRYVAEENIEVVGLGREGPLGTEGQRFISQEDVDGFPIEIGKWFRRFDWNEGRFVSNIKGEYPED